jgi:hypothetical protein
MGPEIKMKPKKRSIASRLRVLDLTVSNSGSNPVIREALLKYGYDESRFEEGKNLAAEAERLSYERDNKRIEQLNATLELRESLASGKRIYADNMKVARVALRDDPVALQKLELTGPRKKAFSAWLIQAKAFYNGALETPEILKKLSRYGLTKKILQRNLELVDKSEAARENRNRLKADARDATKKRNAAMKKAEWWRHDLLAVARVALEGPHLQLLESLGVTIPSEESQKIT